MKKLESHKTAATLDTARHLAVSGGLKTASLQHFPGGWLLVLETAAGGQCFIKTARGQPRLFKNLETAARAAQSLFLPGCFVLFEQWKPHQHTIEGL